MTTASPSPPVHPRRTLTLGIVAHVDAGKTSLTERLLHHAGVVAEPGSVDAGTTTTDTLALERARGITIKAAVVTFALGPADDPVVVNLVDTPGHSDFVAEVERALGILDGAVLVVSAVEGVQAQTRVLMRILRRLGIPTVVFVNKVDRPGARIDDVLAEVHDRLGVRPVPLGHVDASGTRAARFVAHDPADERVRLPLADVLTEGDDDLLADWLRDPSGVDAARLHASLREQTRRGTVCPVLLGSAATGTGVAELAAALPRLLPPTEPDASGPVAGTVFAIQRGRAGEKVALVAVTSGTLRVRDHVPVHDGRAASVREGRAVLESRVTGLEVHAGGGVVRAAFARAGDMARVVGLDTARIGDLLGDRALARSLVHEFAPPTLETVVEPGDASRRGDLHSALTRLAEQDPLIDLRRDEERDETHVSLYGEVQKEVIAATLLDEFGVAATFSATSVICIERVVGVGEAVEVIDIAPNPFLATVGLRVEPGPPGSGIRFALGVEPGSMPPAFFTAVEETVHRTLAQGLLGWQVVDGVVTMTRSGYWPRQSHMHQKFDKSMSSTAGDFRNLTPLVLAAALRRAGTCVEEPVHRFELSVPADQLGAVLTALAHVRAVPGDTAVIGATARVVGEVPAGRVHDLQQLVPGLTSGLGDLVCTFAGHRPSVGPPPSRRRTDLDPLHRREYLLRVAGKL